MSYVVGEDTFGEVSGTQELQELSLVNFMAARGYEPVYDYDIGLCAFMQPRFERSGARRVSVLSAIKMHNTLAEYIFEDGPFHFTPGMTFQKFVQDNRNVEGIIDLFAGTTKIVKRVKLGFGNKRGIILQSDKVEFMTQRDFQQYRSYLGV